MALKRRRAHALEKLAFFCGIFCLIGVGIYALTSWGPVNGWIGIVLVLSGLVIFTAFFNRILDIGRK
jgi:multisubunit Na+/H+ antiporter MnhG subunit